MSFKYVKASQQQFVYYRVLLPRQSQPQNDEVWTYLCTPKTEAMTRSFIGIWTSADGDDPEIRHGNAMFNLQGSGSDDCLREGTGQPNTPGETNEFCVHEIEEWELQAGIDAPSPVTQT